MMIGLENGNWEFLFSQPHNQKNKETCNIIKVANSEPIKRNTFTHCAIKTWNTHCPWKSLKPRI